MVVKDPILPLRSEEARGGVGDYGGEGAHRSKTQVFKLYARIAVNII